MLSFSKMFKHICPCAPDCVWYFFTTSEEPNNIDFFYRNQFDLKSLISTHRYEIEFEQSCKLSATKYFSTMFFIMKIILNIFLDKTD